MPKSKPKAGEISGKVEKPVETKKKPVADDIKVASPYRKRNDEDVVDHQDEREKRKEDHRRDRGTLPPEFPRPH